MTNLLVKYITMHLLNTDEHKQPNIHQLFKKLMLFLEFTYQNSHRTSNNQTFQGGKRFSFDKKMFVSYFDMEIIQEIKENILGGIAKCRAWMDTIIHIFKLFVQQVEDFYTKENISFHITKASNNTLKKLSNFIESENENWKKFLIESSEIKYKKFLYSLKEYNKKSCLKVSSDMDKIEEQFFFKRLKRFYKYFIGDKFFIGQFNIELYPQIKEKLTRLLFLTKASVDDKSINSLKSMTIISGSKDVSKLICKVYDSVVSVKSIHVINELLLNDRSINIAKSFLDASYLSTFADRTLIECEPNCQIYFDYKIYHLQSSLNKFILKEVENILDCLNFNKNIIKLYYEEDVQLQEKALCVDDCTIVKISRTPAYGLKKIIGQTLNNEYISFKPTQVLLLLLSKKFADFYLESDPDQKLRIILDNLGYDRQFYQGNYHFLIDEFYLLNHCEGKEFQVTSSKLSFIQYKILFGTLFNICTITINELFSLAFNQDENNLNSLKIFQHCGAKEEEYLVILFKFPLAEAKYHEDKENSSKASSFNFKQLVNEYGSCDRNNISSIVDSIFKIDERNKILSPDIISRIEKLFTSDYTQNSDLDLYRQINQIYIECLVKKENALKKLKENLNNIKEYISNKQSLLPSEREELKAAIKMIAASKNSDCHFVDIVLDSLGGLKNKIIAKLKINEKDKTANWNKLMANSKIQINCLPLSTYPLQFENSGTHKEENKPGILQQKPQPKNYRTKSVYKFQYNNIDCDARPQSGNIEKHKSDQKVCGNVYVTNISIFNNSNSLIHIKNNAREIGNIGLSSLPRSRPRSCKSKSWK